ncbi:MAG TPA: hypothetical protein VLI72_00130 [Methylibium sp.]|nr:hypothetical protein [Methylibium sp.]
MYLYRVYDACPQAHQVALQDHSGRHHLARMTSDLPRLWEELQGGRPALGFCLLLSPSGHVFRAIFEAVDRPQRILLVH